MLNGVFSFSVLKVFIHPKRFIKTFRCNLMSCAEYKKAKKKILCWLEEAKLKLIQNTIY